MNQRWKNDPRLQSMDPEKIRFLSELSDQLHNASGPQLMNQLLSVTLKARSRGILFTDRETELLTEILTADMDPADRSRVDLLRSLAQKMASRPG